MTRMTGGWQLTYNRRNGRRGSAQPVDASGNQLGVPLHDRIPSVNRFHFLEAPFEDCKGVRLWEEHDSAIGDGNFDLKCSKSLANEVKAGFTDRSGFRRDGTGACNALSQGGCETSRCGWW